MSTEPEIIEEEPQRKVAKAWQPGQSGNPAGRPKGIRQPVDVRERCEALGCDPFRILAMIANKDFVGLDCDEAQITLGSRLKAATELASYIAPKLKSIEIDNGDKQDKTVFVVSLPQSGRETTLENQESEVLEITPDAIREQIVRDLEDEDDESEAS